MSLFDLGVYAPLTPDHSCVTDGVACYRCRSLFAPGMRVSVVPRRETDTTGVKIEFICATCGLRGKEITTPAGRRIVERVRGAYAERPVVTTDGRSWRDEEVGP